MQFTPERMLAAAMLLFGAANEGPPPNLAHKYTDDQIIGIKQGCLLALLPLLLIALEASGDGVVNPDELMDALEVPRDSPLRVFANERLSVLTTDLRRALVEFCEPEEGDDALIMRTLKSSAKAAFQTMDELEDKGEYTKGLRRGVHTTIGGLLFAISQRSGKPLADLCDAFEVPLELKAEFLKRAEDIG